MHRYIPNIQDDAKKMLEAIGAKSIEDLFEDIPKELRLDRSLNLGEGLSEIELSKHMKDLANKNKDIDELICFLGAGA